MWPWNEGSAEFVVDGLGSRERVIVLVTDAVAVLVEEAAGVPEAEFVVLGEDDGSGEDVTDEVFVREADLVTDAVKELDLVFVVLGCAVCDGGVELDPEAALVRDASLVSETVGVPVREGLDEGKAVGEINGVRDLVAENDLDPEGEAALDWDGTLVKLILVVGVLVGVTEGDDEYCKPWQTPSTYSTEPAAYSRPVTSE